MNIDHASTQHLLQFYGGNDRALAASVSRYLAAGIEEGDGIVVIASVPRIEAFMRLLRLHTPYREATQKGRLVCLDAEATLAQVMVDGQPRRDHLDQVVGSVMEEVQRRTGHPRLRVYGEMVDLLWKTGQGKAAMELEEFWNALLAASPDCRLFCAYSLDIFDRDFRPAVVAPILCAHTRLLPVGEALEFAVEWAADEVLGARLRGFHTRPGRPDWAAMPRSVELILWLRETFPDAAERVLRRARRYYEL